MTHRTTSGLFRVRVGKGPPLLAVHGGLGLDHTQLLEGLLPLADQYEIVFMDLEGNGRSPEPEDWTQVTVSLWADGIEKVRAEEGLDDAILFGHSFGGTIALQYALRYGDRIRGLAVSGVTPAWDYPERMMERLAARCGPGEFEALTTALSGPVPDDHTLAALWARLLPVYFHDRDNPAARRLLEQTVYRAAASNHALRWIPPLDLTARLPAIRIPVLVIQGDDDWLIPVDAAGARLVTGLPDATLTVIQDAGHFPFVEQPVAFREAFLAWATRLEGTRVGGA